MPRYIGKEMSRVDGVAKVTGRSGGRRFRPCCLAPDHKNCFAIFSQECARLSRIGREGTQAMSYTSSMSGTVSAPQGHRTYKNRQPEPPFSGCAAEAQVL